MSSASSSGASLVTFDLDLVHSRAPENLERLLAALGELDARGHQLLMTRFGPLDLLGEIGNGHGYDDLLQDAVDFEVHPGVRVHALGLRRLIAVKKMKPQARRISPLCPCWNAPSTNPSAPDTGAGAPLHRHHRPGSSPRRQRPRQPPGTAIIENMGTVRMTEAELARRRQDSETRGPINL